MVHRVLILSASAAAFALLLAATAVADSGIFRSAPLSQIGSRPTALQVGDVDGDDNLDVVVTSTGGDNRILVGVGRGNATFGAFPPGINVGTLPGELTLADLNDDDIGDLAVANTNDGTVTILLGLGTRPAFFGSPGAPIQVGGAPVEIAAGDLNGDNALDLVTANEEVEGSEGTLSVLLGFGDGGFGRVDQDPGEDGVNDLPGQLGTAHVQIADVDGDTVNDIIALNRGSETLSVFSGNGDGTFGAPMVQSLPNVQHFFLADLNDDGDLDLVGALTNLDRVEARLGNGNGSFGGPTSYRVGSAPIRVAVEDVTDDGIPDLIAANARSQDVSILNGIGDGSFQLARTYIADAEPRRLAFGDFNEDGRTDVAVVSEGASGATVAVLRALPNGEFMASEDLAADGKPTELASGDVDGNGYPDVVGVTEVGILFIFPSTGSAGLGERIDVPIGGRTRAVALGDFNRDARLDAVVSDIDGDEVVVLRGQPDGTLRIVQRLDSGMEPAPVVFGDFNQDGRLDIATALVEESELSVFLQNSSGNFGTSVRSPVTLTGLRATPIDMKVIDADCDGNDDLVTANNAIDTVSVLTSNGNGSFTLEQELNPGLVGELPDAIVVSDYDSDGRQDIAVSNSRSSGLGRSVRFFYGGCDGTLEPGDEGNNLSAGLLVTAMTGRDFSGDQIMDLGMVNQTANVARVFLGRGTDGMGDGRFSGRSSDTVSRMPESITAADYDGDGRYDMVVGNTDASANNITWLPNCARDPGCDIFGINDPDGVAASRADANDDGFFSAADFAAIAGEIRDGDGNQVEDVEMGTFAGLPGADANGDGIVDAQDTRALARRIFSGEG